MEKLFVKNEYKKLQRLYKKVGYYINYKIREGKYGTAH